MPHKIITNFDLAIINGCAVTMSTDPKSDLAYVSVKDVVVSFELLQIEVEENFLHVCDYYKEFYIKISPGRGGRKAVPPRYHPILWNQYQTTISDHLITYNINEEFHNWFRVVIKHHPDL